MGIPLSPTAIGPGSALFNAPPIYTLENNLVLGLFVGFVVLLSYMEAGVVNVFGVFIISYISGSLNKLGVNVGVQFMTLYAAPFLLGWLM